jgi:light-regulated signal transduction histidine kinase (bacteriophytochrome)
MAAKRMIISLNDTDQQALRALQARHKLATPAEALRFALRAFDSSPARRTDTAGGQELKELRRANIKLQQFADKAMHDLRGPFSVVATMLELLSRHAQEQQDTEVEKFIDFAIKGVQQMRTVLKELQTSGRVGAPETSKE